MNSGIDSLPLAVWFLLTGLIVFGAVKVGERWGARKRASLGGKREALAGTEAGAVLGLLAFILAFTFGLAASQFDARKQLVLAEANAVGTAALRARLVKGDEGAEIRRLLREYVDIRLRAVAQPAEMPQAIRRSEQLHAEMWNLLETLVKREANPMNSLLVQALNEVIDLHARRITTGLHNRVPVTVWIALYAVAVIALALVGYQSGMTETKRILVPSLLILAFSVVILLIADLDRPQQGMLKVGQRAMLDLQRQMQAEVGPP